MKLKTSTLILLIVFITFGWSSKGGRHPTELKSIIDMEAPKLMNLYSNRLKDIPDLEGALYSKIIIDEFGKVVLFEITKNMLNDSVLELKVEEKVKTWEFSKVQRPGDLTEINLPLIFSLKKSRLK